MLKEETMATWQEIGIDNFQAAVALYDGGFYRNAANRFYYAAFSALTHEHARPRADAALDGDLFCAVQHGATG